MDWIAPDTGDNSSTSKNARSSSRATKNTGDSPGASENTCCTYWIAKYTRRTAQHARSFASTAKDARSASDASQSTGSASHATKNTRSPVIPPSALVAPLRPNNDVHGATPEARDAQPSFAAWTDERVVQTLLAAVTNVHTGFKKLKRSALWLLLVALPPRPSRIGAGQTGELALLDVAEVETAGATANEAADAREDAGETAQATELGIRTGMGLRASRVLRFAGWSSAWGMCLGRARGRMRARVPILTEGRILMLSAVENARVLKGPRAL